MQLYKEKIKAHYLNPQNSGALSKFTHRAKVSNLSCGDEVEIYLNVVDDIITDAHHVTGGCAIAVATASILTSYLLNKSLAEINSLNLEKIQELIGMELAPARQRCATISLEALKDAVASRVAYN